MLTLTVVTNIHDLRDLLKFALFVFGIFRKEIAAISWCLCRAPVCHTGSGFSPAHALPFRKAEFSLCENRSRGLRSVPNTFAGD